MSSRSQRLRQTAGISVLLAFPGLVVFGLYPLAIFNRNAAEFGNDSRVLAPFLVAAAGVALAGLVAGFVLSRRRGELSQAFAAISLGLGCLFVLNDLVTPLRLTKAIGFDGTEGFVPTSPTATAAGLALLLTCFGLTWWRRKAEVPKVGPTLAALLLVMTASPEAWRFWNNTRQLRQSRNDSDWLSVPPASPATVTHPNIYHIILDGFRGSMFSAALKEAGLTEQDFAGFTYYPKNRSNFDGTQTSTPVFLTGSLYHGGSFRAWHNSWNDTGIFREVKTRLGTDIKAYSFGAYHQLTRWIQGRRIEKPDTVRRHQDVILHLALARVAPAFVRPRIFHDGSGLLSPWLASLSPAGDSRLEPLRLLLGDEPVRPAAGEYVFAHFYFPHGPFLVDRNGNPSGQASLLSQSTFALRRIADFLAVLKKAGHYQNSVILIHSDHGWGDQVPAADGEFVPEGIQIETWPRSVRELDNWTSALLLIKPAGAVGAPLAVSARSTQLLDLPNTVYDLLGMPQDAPEGKSVIARDYPVDPERHIFTGFRRWSPAQKRQLWFGLDFFTGELNHFVWTQAGGLEVRPALPVTWEADSIDRASPSVKPATFQGRRIQPTVIELTWPVETNPGECEIQIARGDDEFATIGRGAAGTSNYTVGDVAADAIYRFRARWPANKQTWSEPVVVPPLPK